MWIGDPLVGQLARLAKVGWSSDERLAPLTELLSLKAVEVEWGGMLLEDGDIGPSILALRAVLDRTVESLRSRDSPNQELRDLRVDGPTAADAARHLLALGADQGDLRLGARRRRAAEVWGVQPETFRRHIQTKLLALVAAELRVISGEELADGSAVSSAVGQAMQDALRQAYGEDAKSLGTLVSTVLPQNAYYDDVSVELVLRNHPDHPKEQYLAEYRSGFMAELDEYVVAFVQDASLSDAIMATCPRVNDVWAFSDRQGLDVLLGKLNDGKSYVRAFGSTIDGQTVRRELKLVELAPERASVYLGGLGQWNPEAIHVLHADLSDLRGRFRIATQYEFPMRKDDHYCYWVAPRPLFLRELVFNYAGLTSVGKVNVQPLLGIATVPPEQEAARRTRFDVENWLVPGQGAVLTWSDVR